MTVRLRTFWNLQDMTKKRKRKRKKKILTQFGLHVALVVAVFIRIATRFPSTLTVDTRTRIHRVVLKINLLLEIVKRTIEKWRIPKCFGENQKSNYNPNSLTSGNCHKTRALNSSVRVSALRSFESFLPPPLTGRSCMQGSPNYATSKAEQIRVDESGNAFRLTSTHANPSQGFLKLRSSFGVTTHETEYIYHY